MTDIVKRQEIRTIGEIAERALQLPWPGGQPTKLDMLMDITAVHDRTPLDLDRLASADLGNFCHDIGGIRRHLNRETLELEDGFVPRFLRRKR